MKGETYEVRARGIPCLALITHYHYEPPGRHAPHLCNSTDDFYGFTEIEFTLLDRNGREAPWIDAKMSGTDYEYVEEQIIDQMAHE